MFPLLRNRNFFLLWGGQVISQIGNNFNYIALAWLVLNLTGSAVKMGGVLIAQLLPNALFGLVMGVLADRWNRRHLMIVCDIIRGILVLLIPLLSLLFELPLILIYIDVFLVSSLSLLFTACERAVIPQMVSKADLTEANAFQEMTSQIASLLGPVIAGLLITILPRCVDVLYFDGASFFISALSIALIRYDFRAREESISASQFFAEITEGIRFILSRKKLLVINFTAMAVNFCLYPFIVAFPVYSKEVLLAGASGFGYLMGAVGLGMLLGSLCASAFSRHLARSIILYGGMAIVGMTLIGMGLFPSLIMALALSFLMGYAVAPGNAVIITLVQLSTPDKLMGRSFSMMFSFAALASPLGVAFITPLMEKIGVVSTLYAMGSLIMIVAAVGGTVFRIVEKEAPNS